MGLKEFVTREQTQAEVLATREQYKDAVQTVAERAFDTDMDVVHMSTLPKGLGSSSRYKDGEQMYISTKTPFVRRIDGVWVAIERLERDMSYKFEVRYETESYALLAKNDKESDALTYARVKVKDDLIAYEDEDIHKNGYDQAIDQELVGAFTLVTSTMVAASAGERLRLDIFREKCERERSAVIA